MAKFTLEPTDKHFVDNVRALGDSSHLFHMSIWLDGYPAADCDYIRIVSGRFIGWSPKGIIGENRDDLDKVRQIKFWTKRGES